MGFSPSEKKNLLARLSSLETENAILESEIGKLRSAMKKMSGIIADLASKQTQNPPEEKKSKKA